MSRSRNSRKEILIQKVSIYAPIVLSLLTAGAPFLWGIWNLIRQKLTWDQLKGVGGSLGSIFVTFFSSLLMAREIGAAMAEHARGKFRMDLPSEIRLAFYRRYLVFRFTLLGAYLLAMLIAVGETFLFVTGILSFLIVPSFMVGISIFIGCQILDLFRLGDEWYHISSWQERDKLENQIITTWIGLALLLSGSLVGLLGFSLVSGALLIFSGVVFILKIANVFTPKEPIKKFFDWIGLPLFEGVSQYDLYPKYSLQETYRKLRNDYPFDREEKREEVSDDILPFIYESKVRVKSQKDDEIELHSLNEDEMSFRRFLA